LFRIPRWEEQAELRLERSSATLRTLLRVEITLRRTAVLLPPAFAALALTLATPGRAGEHGRAAAGDSSVERSVAGSAEDGAAAPSRSVHRLAQRGDVVPVHAAFVPSRRKWGDFRVAEGSLPPATTGASCPDGMASIDGRFCIDRWEGSLVEVMPNGSEQPWPNCGMLETGRPVRAVSHPNVYPQAYISGAQAAAACAASGKRLCAPVEWRKACMGPQNLKFGYGSERIAGRCNDQGRSPMLRLYPQVARSWSLVGMAEMNDPRLNQLEGTLAPTGAHEGCTNDYGVYDMVGNLHEWTGDPNGTFQGGYYLDTHINGDGCSYRTVAHEFTYHDYSTGFRCCADVVEP
jgi:hypothetical protein